VHERIKGQYKATEVGLIPDDWDVVSFGSLITDFCGGAPLKPSDFTKTGVKVLVSPHRVVQVEY
jgi:type I restriction enzyme S subunit